MEVADTDVVDTVELVAEAVKDVPDTLVSVADMMI